MTVCRNKEERSIHSDFNPDNCLTCVFAMSTVGKKCGILLLVCAVSEF